VATTTFVRTAETIAQDLGVLESFQGTWNANPSLIHGKTCPAMVISDNVAELVQYAAHQGIH
jgi:hypothetical protein